MSMFFYESDAEVSKRDGVNKGWQIYKYTRTRMQNIKNATISSDIMSVIPVSTVSLFFLGSLIHGVRQFEELHP